jgi:hypothetical protein
LTKLGPLQSLSFRGVMLAGETDTYDATFANGRARIMINLGQDGKLDRANMQAERVGPPGAIIDCAQEGTLKSQVGTSGQITMTVVNRSGGDINLFDISPSGDRYSTAIGPRPPMVDGQSTQRWGGPTNPVVVTDGAGACLEIVLPGIRRAPSSSGPEGHHRGREADRPFLCRMPRTSCANISRRCDAGRRTISR